MWVCASLTHAPSISSKEVHLYFRLTDKQQSLQRTVTAKNNDCKDLSLQRIRTLTAKNDHCKELSPRKTLTAKNFNLQCFKDVSHESFVFTSSTCCFSRKSRAKKFCFHIVKLQFLRGVMHESFVFTTALCSFLTETSHQSFVCTTLTYSFLNVACHHPCTSALS